MANADCGQRGGRGYTWDTLRYTVSLPVQPCSRLILQLPGFPPACVKVDSTSGCRRPLGQTTGSGRGGVGGRQRAQYKGVDCLLSSSRRCRGRRRRSLRGGGGGGGRGEWSDGTTAKSSPLVKDPGKEKPIPVGGNKKPIPVGGKREARPYPRPCCAILHHRPVQYQGHQRQVSSSTPWLRLEK